MKFYSKFFIAFTLGLCSMLSSWAQYTDVPWTVRNSQFTVSDDSQNFTFRTSSGYNAQSDHFVVFWSDGFGSKTGTNITLTYNNVTANVTQMLAKAEECYTKYLELGFIFPNTWNHKIIILLFRNGGVSDMSNQGDYPYVRLAPANVNTAVADPYWTFCHEIGHTFQFLGYYKNGGNAGFKYGNYYGFVSYYECCGNWQSAQLHPHLYFPQASSYDSKFYMKTTNLGWIHQWHCYQSFLMNDYFTEKCGQTTIGDIWTVNTNTRYADPIEKYMYNTGATAEDVYRQFFFGAMRAVTWDLNRWQAYLSAEGTTQDAYMHHKPGTKAAKNSATYYPATYNDNCWQTQSTYQYVTTNSANAIHQVAYSSAPQSTGYNIIKLNVPTGTNRTVTTSFTALAPGANLASGDNKEYWMGSMWATNSSQTTYNKSATSECNSTYNTYRSWRGFRLGYVTYKKSTGKRYYNYTDQVFCTGTNESTVNIQFDVPTDVDSLYLVVSPALSNYLRMGSVDPYNISSNAQFVSTQQSFDQWPYRVQFYNTNIYGLSNPSTTFSGTAQTGTTYTSATLPDLAGNTPEPDPEQDEVTEIDIDVPFGGLDVTNQIVEFNASSTVCQQVLSGLGLSSINDFYNKYEIYYDEHLTHGDDEIMLYGVNADGSYYGIEYTANMGFWYNTSNNVATWDSGFTNDEWNGTLAGYVEHQPYAWDDVNEDWIDYYDRLRFNVGYADDNARTLRTAFRLRNGSSWKTVILKFNLSFTETSTTSTTIYQLTNTLEEGEEYLIVNSNATGSCYALGHTNTTVASDAVTVKAADDISNVLYIKEDDVDATSIWTVATGYTFKNGNYFIRYNNGLTISTTSTNWSWSGTNNRLSYRSGNGTYYLRYNNNAFSVNTSTNSVYLYKKTTITSTETNVGTITVPVEMINSTDIRVNWDGNNTYTQQMLGAFGLSSLSDFYNNYQHYYEGDPASHPNGKYMFYGVNADNSIYGFAYTANQGFFYDASENVVSYEAGESYVEMEYVDVTDENYPTVTDRLQWHFGMPGTNLPVGATKTMRTAMRYYDATNNAMKTFYINFVITVVAPPAIEDDAAMTLTFNLLAPAGDYTPIFAELTAQQVSELNTFYGTQDFTSYYIEDLGLQTTANTMMYYSVNPDGTNSASTAHHPGHWYLPDGTAAGWDNGENSKVYVQFDSDGDDNHTRPTFEVGQAGVSGGDGYQVKSALRFYNGNEYRTVYFVFNVSTGTINDFPLLTLDETSETYNVTAQKGYRVTMNRSLKANGIWNTLTLPFDLTADQIASLGITSVKTMTSAEEMEGKFVINFTDEEEIHAGVPYIVQVSTDKTTLDLSSTPLVVKTAESLKPIVLSDPKPVQMIGNYPKIELDNDVYYIQSNDFHHTNYSGTKKTAMKGFRAYFTVDFGADVKSLVCNFEDDGTATTIDELLGDEIVTNGDIYDLQGRKLSSKRGLESLPRGIYIIGDRKVFVK